MKTYVFPADEHGCGHYRLIWPAKALQAQGHDITIVTPSKRDNMLKGEMNGTTMVRVSIPEDADVIVLQRVTHRYLVQAIKLIRQKGVAVVIDMDDDLTCIHPANPAFAMLHPRTGINPDHSWENTLRACDAATLVTVSTEALVTRYGAKRPTHVLHNTVPKWMLDVPHVDSAEIGWAGAVFSHPTDLQVVGSSVAQLLQAGHTFKVIGPVAGAHAALGIPQTVPIPHSGAIENIEHWPLALNSLGIGVAPLADSKFNQAKSWLKMLEYAAVGVPCVASPRAEYQRLHKLGVGLLARNPNDWKSKLLKLAENESLRLELSEAGRAAAARLTIEDNAWRWHELWSEALSMERSSPLVRASGR